MTQTGIKEAKILFTFIGKNDEWCCRNQGRIQEGSGPQLSAESVAGWRVFMRDVRT